MKKLTIALVMILFTTLNTPHTEAANKTTVRASWYDCMSPGECSRSKITANGERFNPNALTAAHKTLPFGTLLRVTHKGHSVIVRINDRGPFVKGRNLDLSRLAARKIGCKGVCTVSIEIIKRG